MQNKNPTQRVSDERIKLRVLLKNKRVCCVCHASDKAVQLHHIDGNHSKTVETNLAVLCLTHHDQATAGLREGQVGLGVKLSPAEVRVHKSTWEAVVAAELKPNRRSVSQAKRKQLQLLFDFELIRAKNEILASRNAKVSSARFGYLTQYVIEEFISAMPYRKGLLDVFKDVALRGSGDENIALPLVGAVLDLHPHLQGPKYVKLDAADKSALMASIDILDTVGIYGVEVAKAPRTLATVCEGIIELVEIASWYELTTIRNAAMKTVHQFAKALEGKRPALAGSDRLDKRVIGSHARNVDSNDSVHVEP